MSGGRLLGAAGLCGCELSGYAALCCALARRCKLLICAAPLMGYAVGAAAGLCGCELLRYDAPLMGYAVGVAAVLFGCKVAAMWCAADGLCGCELVRYGTPLMGLRRRLCYSVARLLGRREGQRGDGIGLCLSAIWAGNFAAHCCINGNVGLMAVDAALRKSAIGEASMGWRPRREWRHRRFGRRDQFGNLGG